MGTKIGKNVLELNLESLLGRYMAVEPVAGGKSATIIVHTGRTAKPPKDWNSLFVTSDSATKMPIRIVENHTGVYILVSPFASEDLERDPQLKASSDSRIRDAVGQSLAHLERYEVQSAEYILNLPQEQISAAILGLEVGLYRFKRVFKKEAPKFRISVSHRGNAVTKKTLEQGIALGEAINLARHLTNLPPNILHPVSYATAIQKLFSDLKNVDVEVWDEARLEKEKMGLLLAVGQGAQNPPRLVHIRYRPSGAGQRAPFALVGKGITFDSGGLDIKPSSGMRLMKKDMGGSAAVVGLALWAAKSGVKHPIDFYVALAENSVSERSFRPSDVIVARSGHSVEIHNTDAEGRLVLADALDVAVTNRSKPRCVVDIATLTGAIKVALGSHVAGLFCNDVKLAGALSSACQKAGDFAWPMPLIQKYRNSMNSPFADFVNAVDGFGGAVTAALFLERFVRDVPWAHFDIYAWKDAADGAWLESGGSGQMVAGLAHWLRAQPQGR